MKKVEYIMGLIVFIALFNSVVKAQPQKIRRVNIGETVPDIEIPLILQYTKKSAKISDFKGKILILDFWTTYCAGCIKGMPALDSLQGKFKDQIMVLPVAFDSNKADMEAFLLKVKKYGAPIHLPTAVYPSRKNKMMTMFPCFAFPMKVIISEQGKLIAITESYTLTGSNIQKLLRHEKVNFPHAASYVEPESQVEKEVISENQDELFKSSISRYATLQRPLQSRILYKSRNGDKFEMAIYNAPIVELVKASFYGTRTIHDFANQYLSVEIPDSSSFFYPKIDSNYLQNVAKATFSYHLITSKEIADSTALALMKRELSAQFGIQTSYETRSTKCWVLKQIKPLNNLATKDGVPESSGDESTWTLKLQNMPINGLVNWINSLQRPDRKHNPLVFDETGYKNVDLEIQFPITNDINDLNKVLAPYNLYLEEAVRNVNKIVIKKSSI